MLGPGAVVIGIPVALSASLQALRTATDRPFALAALIISVLEALALVFVVGRTLIGAV